MKPDDRNHITVSTHELEARIAELRSQGHYVRAMEVVNKCNGLWRLRIEHGPAQPELAPSAAITPPTNQDVTLRRIRAAAAVAWGSQTPRKKP